MGCFKSPDKALSCSPVGLHPRNSLCLPKGRTIQSEQSCLIPALEELLSPVPPGLRAQEISSLRNSCLPLAGHLSLSV